MGNGVSWMSRVLDLKALLMFILHHSPRLSCFPLDSPLSLTFKNVAGRFLHRFLRAILLVCVRPRSNDRAVVINSGSWCTVGLICINFSLSPNVHLFFSFNLAHSLQCVTTSTNCPSPWVVAVAFYRVCLYILISSFCHHSLTCFGGACSSSHPVNRDHSCYSH